MKRLIVGSATVAMLAAVAGTARAEAITYSVTDLGDLPGGEDTSHAMAVNNTGQVVGISEAAGGRRAFVWQNGVMTDLGVLTNGHSYSFAWDINDAGEIVGTSGVDGTPDGVLSWRPFLYSDGSMTVLTGFEDRHGEARGINNAGQIVGGFGAFLYSDGAMTDLGGLEGRPDYSDAYGINDFGQLVGGVNYVGDSDANRGVLWENGTMTDLGDLPGGFESTRAYAISDAGQVVGESAVASAELGHAFVWQDGVMTDLGVLAGTDSSYAFGLNEYGQVVGKSYSPGTVDSRAFLWDVANGMRDLSDLLDSSGADWTLNDARDINEAGQIVGTGANSDGYQHAFLLTPLHELFPGDANQDLRFDQADILQVLFPRPKYLTGEPATWGEGDWEGAPGGKVGDPPPGNGVFDQKDLVAALAQGHYLTGPYAAAVPEPGTLALVVAGALTWLVCGAAYLRRERGAI